MDIKIGEVGLGILTILLGLWEEEGVEGWRSCLKLRELGETGGAVGAEVILGNELAWEAQGAGELGAVEVR